MSVSDCGDPSPVNGTSNIPTGTTFGDAAILSCDTGYTLIGSTFISCEETGNWSDYPTCEIIGD